MNKVINLFEKREEKHNRDRQDKSLEEVDMIVQMAINKKNKDREIEERKKNNKKVIRDYKLKY